MTLSLGHSVPIVNQNSICLRSQLRSDLRAIFSWGAMPSICSSYVHYVIRMQSVITTSQRVCVASTY